MEKLLLKPSEVGELLGIGRSLTYELIARGEIRSLRLGGCLRVRREWLQQWLNEQENKRQGGE